MRLNKGILIGCTVVTTIGVVSVVLHSVSKNKKQINKIQKEEEISALIDELEHISDEIVSISQNQEQINRLLIEKSRLRSSFMFNPYI